jgi:hypothetical protein
MTPNDYIKIWDYEIMNTFISSVINNYNATYSSKYLEDNLDTLDTMYMNLHDYNTHPIVVYWDSNAL